MNVSGPLGQNALAVFAMLTITIAVSAVLLNAEQPVERWVHTWNGPAGASDYGLLVGHDPAG